MELPDYESNIMSLKTALKSVLGILSRENKSDTFKKNEFEEVMFREYHSSLRECVENITPGRISALNSSKNKRST